MRWRARGRHAAAAEDGIGDIRLRQQHPHVCVSARREECLRLSRLRARIYSSAILRRTRPFRWVALSGEPSDIHVTDDWFWNLFPENRILRRWIDLARKRIKFQGLPGAHLLAGIRRARAVRPGDERSGEERENQSADRDWPRSPRLRLGRVSIPRNREHERRQRTPLPIGLC
jgi:hypothetical protein